jgi:hypothetical protein
MYWNYYSSLQGLSPLHTFPGYKDCWIQLSASAYTESIIFPIAGYQLIAV